MRWDVGAEARPFSYIKMSELKNKKNGYGILWGLTFSEGCKYSFDERKRSIFC